MKLWECMIRKTSSVQNGHWVTTWNASGIHRYRGAIREPSIIYPAARTQGSVCTVLGPTEALTREVVYEIVKREQQLEALALNTLRERMIGAADDDQRELTR